MWWIVGVHVVGWLMTSILLIEAENAKDGLEKILLSMAALFWPIYFFPIAIHKLYEVVRWR